MKKLVCLRLLFVVFFALLASHEPFGQEGNAKSLRFVVYGDTRTDDTAHHRVVTAAVSRKPSFILQTGDLVEDSGIAQQWNTFDNTIQPIRNNHIAYYPAKGNHDATGSRFFKEILDPVQAGYDGKNYYRFDVQGLCFIALDTESLYDGPENKKAQKQFEWLEAQLKQASTAKLFIIPFFHRALYSVGRHRNEKPSLRDWLHPLFVRYGVRLVFQGHDHLYYRTKKDGITYVVTGGGGAPLYEIEQELQPDEKGKSAHHFCAVELSSGDIHVIVYEVERDPKKKDPVEPIDDFHVSPAVDSQK
jgi:predicted phosphodiesterase